MTNDELQKAIDSLLEHRINCLANENSMPKDLQTFLIHLLTEQQKRSK